MSKTETQTVEGEVKRYQPRLSVEKVEKVFKLLGLSEEDSVQKLFETILDKVIEVVEFGEDVPLDDQLIKNYGADLKESNDKLKEYLLKLTESQSKVMEIAEKKEVAPWNYQWVGKWHRVDYDGIDLKVFRIGSYRAGDIIELRSMKQYVVTSIDKEDQKLNVMRLPLHPMSQVRVFDFTDGQEVDEILSVWRI